MADGPASAAEIGVRCRPPECCLCKSAVCVVMWSNSCMVVWLCGRVVVWLYGDMVVWLCGYVRLCCMVLYLVVWYCWWKCGIIGGGGVVGVVCI